MKGLFRALPPGVGSVLVVLAIAYLSLSADPLGASGAHWFPDSDKVAHFVMYFTAAVVFVLDYASVRLPHHTRLNGELALTATAMLLGLLMEVGQLVMSLGRTFDTADIMWNCIGAAAGFAFLRYLGGMRVYRRLTVKRHHHHHHHHSHHKGSKTG